MAVVRKIGRIGLVVGGLKRGVAGIGLRRFAGRRSALPGCARLRQGRRWRGIIGGGCAGCGRGFAATGRQQQRCRNCCEGQADEAGEVTHDTHQTLNSVGKPQTWEARISGTLSPGGKFAPKRQAYLNITSRLTRWAQAIDEPHQWPLEPYVIGDTDCKGQDRDPQYQNGCGHVVAEADGDAAKR